MDESVVAADPVSGEPKSWWDTRWAPVLIGLVLGAFMIAAEGYGYGVPFEWRIAFLGGTGIAIAVFWGKRRRPWFWPAAVLLIVAHIAALVFYHWRMLPHYPMGTAIQLKGAIWSDFAVSGSFLYLVHRLFDPSCRRQSALAA